MERLAILMTKMIKDDLKKFEQLIKIAGEQTKASYPQAWQYLHEQQGPEKYDFIILMTRALHKLWPEIGLNGKRGTRSISIDALALNSSQTVWDVISKVGDKDGSEFQLLNVTHSSVPFQWINPLSRHTHMDYYD